MGWGRVMDQMLIFGVTSLSVILWMHAILHEFVGGSNHSWVSWVARNGCSQPSTVVGGVVLGVIPTILPGFQGTQKDIHHG